MYRRDTVPAYLDPEWQANRGAAALLMPAPIVRDLVRTAADPVEELMRRCGVSYQAATYRVDDARNGRMWLGIAS